MTEQQYVRELVMLNSRYSNELSTTSNEQRCELLMAVFQFNLRLALDALVAGGQVAFGGPTGKGGFDSDLIDRLYTKYLDVLRADVQAAFTAYKMN